jgi:hypothetical protein
VKVSVQEQIINMLIVTGIAFALDFIYRLFLKTLSGECIAPANWTISE